MIPARSSSSVWSHRRRTRTNAHYTVPVLQRQLRLAVVAIARLREILPEMHILELKSRLTKARPGIEW